MTEVWSIDARTGEGNNQPVKRLVAVIVAAAALGAAAAAARAIDANRTKAVKRESTRAAETAGLHANEALTNHIGVLKLKAQISTAGAKPEGAAR